MSEAELRSHDLQAENAEIVEAFMRSKYSNSELYGWMIGELASLYKKAYELAYRAAVAAERAYQYELQSDETFIGFGYWDQSRSGLLAGEILALDLRRMDAAYLDNNRREYELTKRVSLAQIDAYALAQLRETGSCYVSVPELAFDLDHPGHYLRRIKSVSVALPGVTGPHVNVGCTLTLESSKIRVSPLATPEYLETSGADPRFSYRVGKVEQIVTSSGQDSTGTFSGSMDEPRYLPFEGAGAIGTWRIDMPGQHRQFDYRSLADVVITIQYTAREGGSTLRDAALSTMTTAVQNYENVATETGMALLLRAATDFSAAWHSFLYAETASETRELALDLDASRFPHVGAASSGLKITGVRVILVPTSNHNIPNVELERDGVQVGTGTLTSAPATLGGLPTTRWATADLAPGPWKFKLLDPASIPGALRQSYEIGEETYYRFKDGSIHDMLVIVHFAL